MANLNQQAMNCIELFRGNPASMIQRAIKMQNPNVVSEICKILNCTKEQIPYVL